LPNGNVKWQSEKKPKPSALAEKNGHKTTDRTKFPGRLIQKQCGQKMNRNKPTT